MLSYPDPEESDVAYAEHALGASRVEDADEVRECRRMFDHVVRHSLDPEASVGLIERIIAEVLA